MFQKVMEKRRNGEGGFTLIELLVVMVIIGILAAIAIPIFLSQKEAAREAAVKSDLRNAATYAESYAVNHNGTYTGLTVALMQADGFIASDRITLAVTAADATHFVITADHADLGGASPSVDGTYTSNGTPAQLVIP